MAGTFYEPDGQRFISTELTRGPWSSDFQHGGPPSALLTRAIEKLPGGEGKRLAQIAVDLLHPIPVAPVTVRAETIRAGKNVDLSEAILEADGKVLMVAHGWRYRSTEMELGIDTDTPAPPPPSSGRPEPFFPTDHEVGYHTAIEWLFTEGAFMEQGDAQVWMRMRAPLVAGEEPTGAQRALCSSDSASGISARLHTGEFLFVNTDLTVALHREPIGEWLHLDASTTLTDEGAGTTTSTISDRSGTVGTSLQCLFVRARG